MSNTTLFQTDPKDLICTFNAETPLSIFDKMGLAVLTVACPIAMYFVVGNWISYF